jgi:transposase-like protein
MTTRIRCPHCGRYPTIRKNGRLADHRYTWPHKSSGRRCPGSGQIPNQHRLEEQP